MDTEDVFDRLLQAPLASDDEDSQNDKESWTEETNVLPIHRLFHSNENETMDASISSRPRSSRSKRASAVVVPISTLNIIDNNIEALVVRIRLVFIHIGEIDTLNEKFQADVYYEARWRERRISLSVLNLTPQQQTQLLQENLSVKLNEISSNAVWSPQLFIENAIGQIGVQDKWFTLRKHRSRFNDCSSPLFVDMDICEHRRIKGVFWEKLELNHFPADVQDLSISITSHHHVEDCLLVQDEQFRSSINREAFVDQQKWSLYEHVATEMRQTQEEYSFDDESNSKESKKHPVLSVTCRAARRPGFYYWNAFYLIFLITVSAFCVFSITPNLPQNRLQITCTLLLTSVTFRWVVNRSLPTVYYLTTLDIYAILSIMVLVVLCVWHSVVAAVIFYNSPEPISPSNTYVVLDRYVMIAMMALYVLIHVALIIWLIFVPYKRRREMEYLDRQYAAKKHIHLETSRSRLDSTQDLHIGHSPFTVSELPKIKNPQITREAEKVEIVPDPLTFFPVQDESDRTSRKAIDMLELREQDDEFYDHDQSQDELKSVSTNYVEEV